MINFSKTCEVNKFIPKKTFYEKVKISSSIKEEFTEKLNKIYWKYKLSEDTINISKTDNVEEIEIFELELKEKCNAKNLINIITRNIPYPILFYIKHKNEFQYAIKYNEDIFFSDWNKLVTFCFSALNLETLYDNLVKAIANIDDDPKNLEFEIQKRKEIEKLNAELKKLENKMKSEKQFNIRVQYNEEINKIKERLKNV